MENSIKRLVAFMLAIIMSFTVIPFASNTDFTASAASSTAISIKKSPELKVGSIKATSVKLSWGKTKGATSYKIYTSTNKKSWKFIKTTENSSYTVKKLTTGKKYYFKVVAFKNSTKSPDSNIVTVTPKLTKVKVTTVKFNSSEKVTLSWNEVSGATGYEVLYSTNKDFKKGNKKITVSGDKVKYTIKNLKSGKNYFVKVRAIRKLDGKTFTGSYSNKYELITKSKIYYRYNSEKVYATTMVNIRKGPSTSYKKMGNLEKDKSITRVAKGSNGWSKVSYKDGTYYISSNYLTLTKPDTESPRPDFDDDDDSCYICGKENCTPCINDYYCVICKKTISGLTCHPTSHLAASV